jgi:Domain of unknown function (DUF4868)
MPPEQAIAGLKKAMEQNPATNVIVVSEPEDGLRIQRLNLHEELAQEFFATAQEALPEEGTRYIPYDPGYTPDWNQVAYLELANSPTIADLVAEVSKVQQAELFQEEDAIVDHLRFYSVVISPSARRQAVFFRTYSPARELSRKPGFAAVFSKGHYDKIKNKIFLFDRQIDCFSWDGYLFIRSVPAFQRIFKYYEELRAKADETVTAILDRIPIANADAFRESGTRQIQMMSKLAQIARKPYLDQVTMKDIQRTITDFNLELQIVKEGGKQKLLFEPSPNKRWLILKLLDDDYLGSTMTNQKYEVNSKSPLT